LNTDEREIYEQDLHRKRGPWKYACTDGMCGAEDCPRCRPGILLGVGPELEEEEKG
jgi:hypothetical protein